MDIKIFDNNENLIDDIKKNKKERDKKDIDIFITNLYFYAVTIIRIH